MIAFPQKHTQEIASMFGRFAGDGHSTIAERGQLDEQANVFEKRAAEDIESSSQWADMPEVFIVLHTGQPNASNT